MSENKEETNNIFGPMSPEGDAEFLRSLGFCELFELVLRSPVSRACARKDEKLRERYVVAAKIKYYSTHSFYFSPGTEKYLHIMEDFIAAFKTELKEREEAHANEENAKLEAQISNEKKADDEMGVDTKDNGNEEFQNVTKDSNGKEGDEENVLLKTQEKEAKIQEEEHHKEATKIRGKEAASKNRSNAQEEKITYENEGTFQIENENFGEEEPNDDESNAKEKLLANRSGLLAKKKIKIVRFKETDSENDLNNNDEKTANKKESRAQKKKKFLKWKQTDGKNELNSQNSEKMNEKSGNENGANAVKKTKGKKNETP